MSDPKWTAEIEQLVRDAGGVAHVDAAAILTALADAGLLLAPGGETGEEIDRPDPMGNRTFTFGRRRTHHRTVTSWADGSRHYGPWLPVDDGGGA